MELILGNIYARQGEIPVGEQIDGHTHNFDHVTACRSGRIRIIGKRNGETIGETVVDMGGVVLIRADVEHTLIQEPGLPPLVRAALDDLKARMLAGATIEEAYAATVEAQSNVPAEYSCLYAHRTPQGDVVQEYTGWPEAYQ